MKLIRFTYQGSYPAFVDAKEKPYATVDAIIVMPVTEISSIAQIKSPFTESGIEHTIYTRNGKEFIVSADAYEAIITIWETL